MRVGPIGWTHTLHFCHGTRLAPSRKVGLRVSSLKIGLLLLWLGAAVAGFMAILNYQNARGRVGITPQHWPMESRLTLDRSKDTLVMFAHPQCPCTRASVDELNRLLARSEGKVAAQVAFFRPAAFSTDWSRSGLWKSVANIPGVTLLEDIDGVEAKLFGAETSGYVLLYDTQGKLLFHGGITGGRGHAGDNAGEDAMFSLLKGQVTSLTQSPVYGCSLLDRCEVPKEVTTK